MDLTKRQITQLKNYQRNRQTGPNPLLVLKRFPRWIIGVFAVGIAFGVYGLVSGGSPRFGCYLLGFISGTICLFCFRLSAALRSWPLTREITDWHRVERLLEENERRIS